MRKLSLVITFIAAAIVLVTVPENIKFVHYILAFSAALFALKQLKDFFSERQNKSEIKN